MKILFVIFDFNSQKQPTSYPLLVSNTSRLLACVIAELSASAISSDVSIQKVKGLEFHLWLSKAIFKNV